MHNCVNRNVMLVNKLAIAAWVMAIVTPVVTMAEWVIDTTYYTRIIICMNLYKSADECMYMCVHA